MSKESNIDQFIVGGGEMGTRIRDFDWSKTPLGSPETWPHSLRTTINLILNAAFPMCIAWGEDYIQLYNDAFRPILGAKNHPFALGVGSYQTFSDSWDVFRPAADQARAGIPTSLTNQIVMMEHPNGPQEHYFTYSFSPIKEGREVYGVLMIATETTNQALSDRLETVLNNLDGAFTIFDHEMRYVYLNHQSSELARISTGLTRDEIIGKTVEEAYPELIGTRVYNELYNAQRQQVPIVFRIYRDVYKMWVEYRLYPGPDTLAVLMMDITQHIQEEKERLQLNTMLEEERQRLSNIIATVPGVIWENSHVDEREEMKLVFISAYVETMLGYTVEEALAEPHFWFRIFHPEDAQKTAEAFNKVRRSRGSGVINFRAIHKNGRVIDVQALMITILKDEKPIGKRGVMMDVSERQRLIEAQVRYATMLRRSNEELQQFAYVASHDLQEPLRMVTSYLQLIESRYASKLDSDAHEFIGFAVDGAARMKALINDLLAYSRVEGGEKIFEEFDSQLALNKALSDLSLKLEDSHSIVTYDPMPAIKADRTQITQLFQNLLSNAIKFQRPGNAPHVHIGVQRVNNEWQFSVQDNGIGIAPAYLDRIFIIFQRLHKKSEYPGTGIGLAICKKVVERHGGRIWVESTPGEGTTFYFTLPA